MTGAKPGRPRWTARRRIIRTLAVLGWILLAAVAWAMTYALLVIGGH